MKQSEKVEDSKQEKSLKKDHRMLPGTYLKTQKVRERDEEDGEEIGRAREEIQEEEIAGMERREEGREEDEREAQEEEE